jgi:hypothetical protein
MSVSRPLCPRRSTAAAIGETTARSRREESVDVSAELSLLVHLSSLVVRRSRACSFEKAEVELDHDQRELRHRIAWLSERLAAGATPTAQIRPTRKPTIVP